MTARTRFSVWPRGDLLLPALALGVGCAGLAPNFVPVADWTGTWRGLADVGASVVLATVCIALAAAWAIQAVTGALDAESVPINPRYRTARRDGWRQAWPVLLLVVCTVEAALHVGEHNPFVATSRPTANVETWTTADGYAMLLDGNIAQADGALLLQMLNAFLGAGAWGPSELDRRAGHVWLVSLLVPALGGYWSFVAINVLAWWGAALAVLWLGRKRWPGNWTGEIGSLLTATGVGFIFMSGAPQAQAVAYGAFALVLALFDRLATRGERDALRRWAALGWAAGAGGLLYLVHIPSILFAWLYGWSRGTRRRLAGPLVATAVALGIVMMWERLGTSLLGLTFTGGNNDLAGEALRGWASVLRAGPGGLVGYFHEASFRGLLVSAFYYPWLVLAAVGLVASGRNNRRWALAVIVCAALPALAFSTRFQLPRLVYFMFPAVYLLAARGIEGLGRRALGIALLVAALITLSNADLVGIDQLFKWFHYSQGNTW
jgi:hypothetical protein